MRVRAAAGLNIRHVHRIADVGDVEDSDATQSILTYCFLNTLSSAVKSSAETLTGNKHQVAVDRNVALGRRAQILGDEHRFGRVRDVPDNHAIVVTLNCVVAFKRQVGVGYSDEILRWGRRRRQLEVPQCLLGIKETCSESYARIRAGRHPRCIVAGHWFHVHHVAVGGSVHAVHVGHGRVSLLCDRLGCARRNTDEHCRNKQRKEGIGSQPVARQTGEHFAFHWYGLGWIQGEPRALRGKVTAFGH